MAFVATLLSEHVTDRERGAWGNKAFVLSELCQDGFPVPPGFVIRTEAFDSFMASNGINDGDMGSSIAEQFQELRRRVLEGRVPPDVEDVILRHVGTLHNECVAIRSSATFEDSESQSCAGQFDSFLGVTRETLIANIKSCWASLFTHRPDGCGAQRMEVGKMAVIVQEMVDADVSGVCFSADPVTGDSGRIVIEAISGLGELLVQGLVVPDQYTVEKDTFAILHKRVSAQQQELRLKIPGGGLRISLPNPCIRAQKAEDEAIRAVADLALQVERKYRRAIDIEWALNGKQLFLLQARPVTTPSLASHE